MNVVAGIWLLFSAFGFIDAVTLSPCGTDNTVEVVENKGDNTVSCYGIPGSEYTVDWELTLPGASPAKILGTCDTGGCTDFSYIGYRASRPSADISVLTINPSTSVGVNFIKDGTLTCLARTSKGEARSNSCRLDIISLTQRPSCSVQPATTGSAFTVAGRCDVTKAYSYLGRYNCQWYIEESTETAVNQPVPIVKTADNGATATGGTYISGHCDVTMSWPTYDATYNYRVVVTPGGQSHNAGTLAIRKPIPSHNCPQYVAESRTLTCTCAGDTGLPPVDLRWNITGSSTLTVSYVKRSQTGSQYQCQAVLSGVVVEQAVYTLNVAYGPDSATISVPDPLDTDGTRDMTLNCSASGSIPPPIFSWTRAGSSAAPREGHSYTFRPQPPTDDGAVLQCRAENKVSNEATTATVTVSLRYPPTTDPVITNKSSDGNLYQGDSVTFTCTVTGGKPVNATSMNLTCPRTQSATGTAVSAGVTSSVTLTSVSDGDHNQQCTCRTTWKGTSWYTKNIQTSLYVITPPSLPVINVVNQDFPFIAGGKEEAVLTCVSQTPGRPAARYSWPVNWGGQNGVDGQGRGTLTFHTLGKDDDGKVVTCKASNLYTDHKQQNVEETFTLQVYYPPDITLSSQEKNDCSGPTQDHCEVTEGQRVHFRCSADSSPAPQGFKWTSDGGSDTGSATGSDILDIAAANHTVHNRQYTCTVTTGRLSNNRQPLTSSKLLTVVVKYKPVTTKLTLNTQKESLSIDENSTVVLACQADGRPTPSMELTGGLQAASSDKEVTFLEDRYTWYYTLTAQCHHTGQYRCRASNSVGEGPTDIAMLFVNCKPRKNDTFPLETPTVNYVNTPQEVIFNLVAYPVPDNFTFSYLGPSPDNRSQTAGPVTSNTLQMNCFTTNFLYNVTCNVTVDNITSVREAGLYGVTVSNAFGHVDLEFMLMFNESMVDEQTYKKSFIGAALAGGIAAAVVVIIVAAVIVLFIRRRRRGSEDSVLGHTKGDKSDKIKLATPDHSGVKSTNDEAMETYEKSHRKPTAVVSPKRTSKSRTHHGKSGALYENVELNGPARHHREEHLPSNSAEYNVSANQLMSSSLNHSSTADHPTASNVCEDQAANTSLHKNTASPAAQKHTPNPPAHHTINTPGKKHTSTQRSRKPPPSPLTHTEVIIADAYDHEEMEHADDDAKVSETALYNDVEYMTSQGATLGLDRTQQYLLDKLRGSHLNEEFGKLVAGHQRDITVGSKEENRSKNRFNNSILPYDANRVVLLGDFNDYINASLIRGYSSSKSYIAAQGPKKNTVIDFWKMVWQEKITHIAMLTNLTEGEKIKCAEYWPPHGKNIRYGSVIVTSIDISRRANCVVRTFEIKGSGDGPSCQVSQYHFVTWLDHSIPSATALVDFWRTVSASYGNQTSHSPLLVHCSAGIGRTGSFIALDIAMETVHDGAEVNVFHIIQCMRKERINMVQTASQYRFVHEAILEAYTSRHSRLALLAFNSFFPNDVDPNKRIDKIDHEFKLLNQMKVLLHKPSRTVASSEENFKKNRTMIFPDDSHLVYLSTFVKGRNQYINAVLVPTFYDRRGCILTQLPLQDTLVDIWRLVHGNDVTTIVSIGAEVDGAEVKCCYWPWRDGESTKFGPFTITLKSKAARGKHLTSYELSVQLKNFTESREISLLQYRGWTGEVPDSTQDFLQLVNLVNSRSVRDHEDEEDKETGPVIVQCMDGATKSGLFRVICDVISRMTYDHDVDVYMAVRHVQIVRPESVASEVQYRYVYHVIQEYQKRTAVYNN